jgi:hypothetical protein
MITLTEQFTNVEIMDSFIVGYLKQYAPAGYGTTVTIKLLQSYDEWLVNKRRYEVTLERSESCD